LNLRLIVDFTGTLSFWATQWLQINFSVAFA
jgi:hypothetical protein